jgi:hypothetical protein
MKSSYPYDLGKQVLVEDCQKISISGYIREANRKLKETLLTAEVQLANKSIELTPSKTAFGGTRYWFKCPLCAGRAGTLFAHPLTSEIGCRECLGLEYKSRRYKGMIEAVK